MEKLGVDRTMGSSPFVTGRRVEYRAVDRTCRTSRSYFSDGFYFLSDIGTKARTKREDSDRRYLYFEVQSMG